MSNIVDRSQSDGQGSSEEKANNVNTGCPNTASDGYQSNIETVESQVETTTLDDDFNRMVRAFEALSKVGSGLKRRFLLSKVAAFHGFPRAEFRKLYELWITEQVQGGAE